MNIELDYQPHSQYRGQTVQTATGIGGYYAKVNIEVSADEADLIEVGPHDTLAHALHVLRDRINETLFVRGIN